MSKFLQFSKKKPKLLDKHSIHIWIIDLSKHILSASNYFHMLSTTEQKKALSYKFTVHKSYYTIRTALLRTIISKYCDLKIMDIDIGLGPFGKPYLKNSSVDLHFNVSHSENFTYIAMTKSGEIGIDLECAHERQDLDSLARYVLHENEYCTFKSIVYSEQLMYFYRIWSLKEAIVKSVGIGLNYPLSKIQIPKNIQESDLKLVKLHPLKEERILRLKILKAPPSFVGSLATKIDIKKIEYIHL